MAYIITMTSGLHHPMLWEAGGACYLSGIEPLQPCEHLPTCPRNLHQGIWIRHQAGHTHPTEAYLYAYPPVEDTSTANAGRTGEENSLETVVSQDKISR